MDSDFSASFLRFTNDIAHFYDGMREYWSTRTLMQGYGEATKDITELVEEATRSSNPMVQACAGSGQAVAKMLGAIPIGIDHWVIETARFTVRRGVGAGIRTLISIPLEGFIDGGKFVLHQLKRWSRGEIAPTTFGVADEVATTLGTAGLMFLGIKGIHGGGTRLINGIKNVEWPLQALATSTGHVMPVAVGSEAIAGGGPMAAGLVFMVSKKDPSENGTPKTKTEEEKASPSAKVLDELLDSAERKSQGAVETIKRMDLEAVINITKSPRQRARFLGILSNQGETQALRTQAIQTLGVLAKKGEKLSKLELLDVLKNYHRPHLSKEANLELRQQAFKELIELPDRRATAFELIEILHRLPPDELGVPVLNWLIKESVQTPRVAKYLKNQDLNGHFPDYWKPYLSRTYTHADFSPIYELARTKLVYREILASALQWIRMNDPAMAQGTMVYRILKEMGMEG